MNLIRGKPPDLLILMIPLTNCSFECKSFIDFNRSSTQKFWWRALFVASQVQAQILHSVEPPFWYHDSAAQGLQRLCWYSLMKGTFSSKSLLTESLKEFASLHKSSFEPQQFLG